MCSSDLVYLAEGKLKPLPATWRFALPSALLLSAAFVLLVEGLARGGVLSPVQHAFIEHDAFQCGYCTPGQIVRASALLAEPLPVDAAAREAHVRHAMSGNICRCTGYTGIVDAVLSTAARRAGRAA